MEILKKLRWKFHNPISQCFEATDLIIQISCFEALTDWIMKFPTKFLQYLHILGNALSDENDDVIIASLGQFTVILDQPDVIARIFKDYFSRIIELVGNTKVSESAILFLERLHRIESFGHDHLRELFDLLRRDLQYVEAAIGKFIDKNFLPKSSGIRDRLTSLLGVLRFVDSGVVRVRVIDAVLEYSLMMDDWTSMVYMLNNVDQELDVFDERNMATILFTSMRKYSGEEYGLKGNMTTQLLLGYGKLLKKYQNNGSIMLFLAQGVSFLQSDMLEENQEFGAALGSIYDTFLLYGESEVLRCCCLEALYFVYEESERKGDVRAESCELLNSLTDGLMMDMREQHERAADVSEAEEGVPTLSKHALAVVRIFMENLNRLKEAGENTVVVMGLDENE
ncbi:Sister-chromatid cohesion protein 3 [Linum grandiflorum]